MALTPISIRGKRKPAKASSNASKPLDLVPRKAQRSLASVLATQTYRSRASLESLPAEILESIFLYSASLSLPRASAVIGLKLSSKATRLRAFIWAFHDTWDQWFGIPRIMLHKPDPQREAHGACDGDPILQSAMLNLPWIDAEFVLQAQQAWADRYARDRPFMHNLPAGDEEKEGNPEHDWSGRAGHFNAHACFEAEYQRALGWQTVFCGPRRPWGRQWGYQDVHEDTRMPTRLLTGPWDDRSRRLLYFLARGGLGHQVRYKGPREVRQASYHHDLPWELKLQCLENAVVSAEKLDYVVINCLFRNDVFSGLPASEVSQLKIRLNRRTEWGGDEPHDRDTLVMIYRELDRLA